VVNVKERQQLTDLAHRWETEAQFWKGRTPETLPDMDREALAGEIKVAKFLASIYDDHARAIRGLTSG
jgi:hypothetical protein